MHNLEPKMPYLHTSGQEFHPNYCHTWNQHPRVFQIWVWAHTFYLGIGSLSSKGLGSTFSEDLGWGPVLHYKVCPLDYKILNKFFSLTVYSACLGTTCSKHAISEI